MDDTNRPSAPPNGASEPGSATLTRAPRSHLPLAVAAGTVLRDRYRLTDTLEVGQVATLYRAEVVETGRAVAVKVFHEIGRNDRSRIEILHRPTPRGAARLDLPGAFVVVDECDLTDDGRLFLVTELVEGPSVADLLRRTPPLAPARALELAMRIGEALEQILNLGLLDLPVTPRDIIVDNADRVKLLRSDALVFRRLGLADQLAAAEAPGRDLRYASPEELAGLPATERSVVYRFGVLLYQLLSGTPPFEGTTPADVRNRQLRPLPRRLQDRHPALPASLGRLVSRMLDPDPMARPVDLTWILNELWDAACRLRGETPVAPTHAATSSASVAPEPSVRRPRTRRWVLASLPILLVGGTFLAWRYLAVAPSVPASAPASIRPAVDVSPPPAPVAAAPPLVFPPSDPPAAGSRVSTQVPGFHPPAQLPAPVAEQLTADGTGSLPRLRGNAPAAPRVALPETPAPTPGAKAVSPTVAPAREPPPPPQPVDVPAARRAGAPTEPELTSARAAPAPPPQPETAVTPPPVRPSQSLPQNPRTMDPGAIIEWLVRESPRIGE